MMRFIDISDWQHGIDLPLATKNVDAVIVKATEGDYYTASRFQKWAEWLASSGKPFGFYHFAGISAAKAEAEYFVSECNDFWGLGVPVLDWECSQSIDWVNEFVERVHELTSVWPWVYGNPWHFDQGELNKNCAVWVASYPNVTSPRFEDAASWECPSANGNVIAWQFCSDGKLLGYDGNLDCSLFYGDVKAWRAYAAGNRKNEPSINATVFENDEMKVTVEIKK